MKTYSVIDLGSNSIRLSVYQYRDNQIVRLFAKKEVAGLVGYVYDGVLSGDGIEKACEVLADFREAASEYSEPRDIHVFATASLRNVKNGTGAALAIREKTGLITDVLSGEDEAALGFAGAHKFTGCSNGVMIDIGGASTELVQYENHRPVRMLSLPIGCLSLAMEHVSRITPTEDENRRIRDAIRTHFDKIDWEADANFRLEVGTGGTVRAALRLSHMLYGKPREDNRISALHAVDITHRLENNVDDIFKKVHKAIPERLITISTGLEILNTAIGKFRCESIIVSKFGVREGYFLDRVLKENDSLYRREQGAGNRS